MPSGEEERHGVRSGDEAIGGFQKPNAIPTVQPLANEPRACPGTGLRLMDPVPREKNGLTGVNC